MNKISEALFKALSSKKNISIIYALWIVINYRYLQSYMQGVSHTAYYGDFGSMNSMAIFLSYIILTFSLVTVAYFLWVIWFDREHKDRLHVFIRILISALILYIVIVTPYWFKSIYEELPYYKFWGDGEWDTFENGNFTTLRTNPALARFDVVSFNSYILCFTSSVFIYIWESSREINSNSVIKNIFQIVFYYILYGIVTNWVFFILSSPCFVLLAMVRFRIIPSKICKLIYVLIIAYVLGTIAFCGIMGEAMTLKGTGPISPLYIVALSGIYFNVYFYFAVFIGIILVWIKNIGKIKWENTFFKGFIVALICGPDLLFFILECLKK